MPFFHSTVKLHVTRMLARMFEESTRSHGKLSEIRCLKKTHSTSRQERKMLIMYLVRFGSVKAFYFYSPCMANWTGENRISILKYSWKPNYFTDGQNNDTYLRARQTSWKIAIKLHL